MQVIPRSSAVSPRHAGASAPEELSVKSRVPFFALAVAVFAAGCGDAPLTSPRLSPGQPNTVLSDGTRLGGNEDFFFLPPIAANPKDNPNYDAGKFNPNLAPVVRVCLLSTEDLTKLADAHCVSEAAVITSSEIRAAEQFYQVVWHVRDAGLDPDGIYRLQVFVGSTRLGFADLAVANTKGEAKSAITNEVFPISADRSLPIKFRIETGALGACQRSPNDCTEVSVTPAGGTFFTNTHFAGVKLDPKWASPAAFAAGGGTILLTIERVTLEEGQSCHGAEGVTGRLIEELSGCYHYTTQPDLDEDPDGEGPQTSFGGFQTAGNVAAQCAGRARTAENSDEDWLLFKSDPGRPLQALRDVPEPAGLNCADFAFFEGLPSNPVLRFASLKWHSVTRVVSRVVGVKEAYAWDTGLGGLLGIGDGFSNISRGRGVQIEMGAGDEQSLPIGGRAPIDPTVRISGVHIHAGGEGESHEPVAGVSVTFTVQGGNFGFDEETEQPITELIVETIANGEASVPWYVTATSSSVTATAATVVPRTIKFGATGIVNGSIAGLVTDARGLRLGGALVRLVSTNDETFEPRSTTTAAAGQFSFLDLPAGTYSVAAASVGFDMDRQVVPLDQGANETADLVLVRTGQVLYGVNANDDGLSIIDPATARSTFIGKLHPAANRFVAPVAMATDPRSGTIYVWNNDTGGAEGSVLVTVDACTGRATQISTASQLSVAGTGAALAISPTTGTMYLTNSNDDVFTVDKATGVVTRIGSLGTGITVFGADFDSEGVLYGITNFGDKLYTINTSTGAATLAANLSPPVGIAGSIVFTPSGGLLGTSIATGKIFDIDKATGTVSNSRTLTVTSPSIAPQGMGFAGDCARGSP
jgi:carboxypeptidase family protein/uncharacterized protein DUF6923